MTTEQNKKCIISFANAKNNYAKGLARLSESLRNNFDGDFIGFISEASCGAESHDDNPYNFKIHCIKKAIGAGYEQILWLDSSVFAIRDTSAVFEHIANNAIIVQDSGHWLGTWANDKSLEYFGITRDEAMEIRMIGNAGLLGLNMNHSTTHQFFEEWQCAMINGIFKGQWNNNNKTESQDERCLGHRHDMVASSAILYKMGIIPGAMISGEELLQYAGIYDATLNDTIIFKAQGI